MRVIVTTALAISSAIAIPAVGAAHAREPTIRTEHAPISGHLVRYRTWEFGVGEVSLRDLTIAEADYLWRDYPADHLEPIRGKLSCSIVDGRIQPERCTGSCSDEFPDPCGGVIGGLGRLEAVRFPELTDFEASEQYLDSISIEFELDPRKRPAIDLNQGELRDAKQIIASTSAITMRDIYPARAVRQELEGNMTLTCQVQADISVICRQEAFAPAEYGALFAPTAARIGLLLEVKRELPDGSSTAGSRFKWRAAFRLS